jgi:protein-disulfide isomerase
MLLVLMLAASGMLASGTAAAQSITVEQILGALAEGPALGPLEAPVTIIEFSDFQCSFCKKFWAETFPRLKEAYIKPGRVRFVYRHLAILGEHSVQAALAAECAGDQRKFWEYHDRLFGSQGPLAYTRTRLAGYAKELDLDVGGFGQCLESGKYLKKVETDTKLAQFLGARGTPAFLVNGRLLIGAHPFETFETVIQAAEKASAPSEGGSPRSAVAELPTPGTPPAVHHIHGLALDQTNPEVLYIATHTGLVRVRPNAVAEWVGSHRFDLMGFTTHPREANVVYASGHPDAPTYRREGIGNLGLLLSRDGGQTWQTVALKGEADFHSLTYSPRDGGHLYGWSVAGQVGLHRISAATWVSERLPAQGLSDVLSLAASPDPSGPLLAGTRAGMMLSRDAGVTWVRVTAIPANVPVTAVAYHAKDPRLVYAYASRSDLGLMRSRDGGATWEPTGFVADAGTPVIAAAVGPGEHAVIATTRSDVLRSGDGARTWRRILEQGRWASGAR